MNSVLFGVYNSFEKNLVQISKFRLLCFAINNCIWKTTQSRLGMGIIIVRIYPWDCSFFIASPSMSSLYLVYNIAWLHGNCMMTSSGVYDGQLLLVTKYLDLHSSRRHSFLCKTKVLLATKAIQSSRSKLDLPHRSLRCYISAFCVTQQELTLGLWRG